MVNIAIEELRLLCSQVLVKTGARPEDIVKIIDHLVENECSGKASHGMVRIPQVIKAIHRHGPCDIDPEIVIDNEQVCVLDAHKNVGLVACIYAMEQALQRSKKNGIAIVGVRNYIGTSGSMAYYLRRIADKGLIAIMGCNSEALVAPPGGKTPMIGTNPIGIAIPGKDGPAMIADLATSAIAYGKIMVAKDKGESIPDNVMIDGDGNVSTNPEDADKGAILPLLDHKGFALGLMVELLAGPLIGSSAIKKETPEGDGMFMIVIDPQKFGNPLFYQQISDAVKMIKGSDLRPGYKAISIAGDRSANILSKSLSNGFIDVADNTLSNIRNYL